MLTLSVLPEAFGLCRLASSAEIPSWATEGSFFSITKTPEELSIVCPMASMPRGILAQRGWRCLKVHGPLDFNQIGVLRSLAGPLAQAGVSLFAVSTYDTDYLLVRERDLPKAIEALRSVGHRVNEEG